MAAASTSPHLSEQILRKCAAQAGTRMDFWAEFLRSMNVQCMAEIGVYRGDFAAAMLQGCPALTRYYMLDPWRHLSGWNKPANEDSSVFDRFFEETQSKTTFAASKRVILRGKTTEVVDQIGDGELDLAYVDGDHTLRGVTIDLVRLYPKIRVDGFLAGDDFSSSIWHHNSRFEPTLVFPFAVYFAEAIGATVYALPHSQFCMHKTRIAGFSFIDLTGRYDNLELRNQVEPGKLLKVLARERFPRLARTIRKVRSLFS
jgi:hypothetical protein